MLWSKSKPTQTAEETQSECKEEPTQVKDAQSSHTDEAQYPSLKVVLPNVLAVCLVVFLTALVSLLRHLPRIMIQLSDQTTIRTEPLLASLFPRYQIISTPSMTYLGTSPRTSSPHAPYSCPWARSMYVRAPIPWTLD